MSAPLYLKWTRTGRVPSYQGGASIPRERWTPRITNPVLCSRGWHACRWEDTLAHISDELWICKLDTVTEGPDKVVAERLILVEQVAGINERTLRLFAADCAESVLHLFERERPGDDRPRKAIEAARLFANGKITGAARAAAGAAAWAAARDAAWAAARAAAQDAAGDAARAAAQDAAGDAAGAAVWAAAGAAAGQNLLVNYGGLDPALFAHRVPT